jgi:L-rhamnose mutarotase
MERIVFLLQIRKGFEEEYVKRHANVWPQVLEEMEQAGIEAMNIYLAGRQVVVFMEVEDYVRSVELLAKAPASVRWEQFMAPIMEGDSAGPYDPEKAWPSGLPEVFRWNTPKEPTKETSYP